MIKVDVVIPVYNGVRFLNTVIESVSKQSYPLNRIIVVDDGSTDSTKKNLNDLEAVHKNLFTISVEHAGLSAARNSGWKSSDAEFIAFLDVDDTWSSTKIESQVNHLKDHIDCNFVYSSSRILQEGDSKVSYLDGINNSPANPLNILTKRFVLSGSASSVMMRRSLLGELNGFDEELKYGEDLDLWIRASKITDFCHVPSRDVNILKAYGGMQSNVRGLENVFKHNTLILKMIEKNFSNSNLAKYRRELRSIFWGDLKKNLFFGLFHFRKIYSEFRVCFPVASRLLFHNFFDFLMSFVSVVIVRFGRILRRKLGFANEG